MIARAECCSVYEQSTQWGWTAGIAAHSFPALLLAALPPALLLAALLPALLLAALPPAACMAFHADPVCLAPLCMACNRALMLLEEI